MKNLIILLSLVGISATSHAVFAQDAAQLKDVSMQACDAQAAQVPEAQRELMSKICKCTVENTDYEAFLEKSASGDESVQADAIAVAQKCAEENS
jgi:hypothetical protein